MKFYTNAYISGDWIYIRGYKENGERFQERTKVEPYMFFLSNVGDYKTLEGKIAKRKDFPSISDFKEYMKGCPVEVYGNLNFLYQHLNTEFYGDIKFDTSLISTVTIDIEVMSLEGFPNIRTAISPVTAITLTHNKKTKYVFGLFPYYKEGVKYIHCKNEVELFRHFIKVWKELDPDIITGWNIESFDIPYIINRMKTLEKDGLPKDYYQELSPWKNGVWDSPVYFKDKNKESLETYHIKGRSVIDYLPLFKKFYSSKMESYSLNQVALEILGEEKIDYSAYGTLNDLYEKNHDLYIDYNIYDCVLVDKIDAKQNYINQVISLAYLIKINYLDAFATVKPWDVFITNYLLESNIVVPQSKTEDENENDETIMGGFVKPPQIGYHKWIVTFDVVSEYPHVIMACNISPETFIRKDKSWIVGDIVKNGFPADLSQKMKDENVVMTAEGCLYDHSRVGFFPALQKKIFNGRKEAKVKLKELKKNKATENEISALDNYQLALKILLNGGYGAMANPHFRFYNSDMAESVTSTGQFLIKTVEAAVNSYVNQILKTKDIDYVVAMDTDSIHLTLDGLVERVGLSAAQVDKVVEFLDKVAKEKFLPLIEKTCNDFCDNINAIEKCFKMERETIADKVIWRAAKMYIMNARDVEGYRPEKPIMKIKGLEAVRSNIPFATRVKMKEAYRMMMNSEENEFQEFVKKYEDEFLSASFQVVATPKSVRGLTKYHDPYFIYKKGTPMHVKGALIYNHLLKKLDLTNKYRLIYDGDKIKYSYLSQPNYLQETVIASPDELPEEFELNKCVDRKLQFEKVFKSPLESLLKLRKWDFYSNKETSVLDMFM